MRNSEKNENANSLKPFFFFKEKSVPEVRCKEEQTVSVQSICPSSRGDVTTDWHFRLFNGFNFKKLLVPPAEGRPLFSFSFFSRQICVTHKRFSHRLPLFFQASLLFQFAHSFGCFPLVFCIFSFLEWFFYFTSAVFPFTADCTVHMADQYEDNEAILKIA